MSSLQVTRGYQHLYVVSGGEGAADAPATAVGMTFWGGSLNMDGHELGVSDTTVCVRAMKISHAAEGGARTVFGSL